MRVEPLQPGGEAEWNAFCREQPTAWFWHTTDWTSYQQEARPERRARSLEFVIRDGTELLAVVPLACEGGELVLGGAPCWAPAIRADLDEDRALEVARLALEHVDGVAAEHDARRAAFQLSPLVAGNERFAAAAIRAGYLDVSRTSQVLELGGELDQVRRRMSKGHRAAIKKGVAQFPAEARSSHEALHAFRALHEAAAGRRTRPPETYDRWAQWAQRGDGVVLLTRGDGDEYVGGMFVSVFAGRAYYLAAAMDRALTNQPVGHALQWFAIGWLAERGVHRYELGLQQFGPLLHDVPTDKERNISRFKRGFGGVTRWAPAYEKWYSPAALRATLQARLDAYSTELERSL